MYDSGKYQPAEKFLFSLKEILASEYTSHLDLILQIFWGLLACEIINQKERGVVENTTLRRIREITDKMFMEFIINKIEHFN